MVYFDPALAARTISIPRDAIRHFGCTQPPARDALVILLKNGGKRSLSTAFLDRPGSAIASTLFEHVLMP